MKLTMIAAAFVLATAANVSAQTTVQTVPTGTPITVEFEHAQSLSEVSFRALVDGAIVKNFVTADFTVTAKPVCAAPVPSPCSTYRATIPPVARGKHTLLVRAYNELGQADSTPLDFVAAVPPQAPGVPKVSVTLTLAGVTVDVK